MNETKSLNLIKTYIKSHNVKNIYRGDAQSEKQIEKERERDMSDKSPQKSSQIKFHNSQIRRKKKRKEK